MDRIERVVPVVGIEQAGFLHDLAAALDHVDLTARLMLDRLHDEAHRIDVLGLGPGAEFLARPAHRHVDVGAHRALIHIAVARADIAQDRPQLATGKPLLRRANACPGG